MREIDFFNYDNYELAESQDVIVAGNHIVSFNVRPFVSYVNYDGSEVESFVWEIDVSSLDENMEIDDSMLRYTTQEAEDSAWETFYVLYEKVCKEIGIEPKYVL